MTNRMRDPPDEVTSPPSPVVGDIGNKRKSSRFQKLRMSIRSSDEEDASTLKHLKQKLNRRRLSIGNNKSSKEAHHPASPSASTNETAISTSERHPQQQQQQTNKNSKFARKSMTVGAKLRQSIKGASVQLITMRKEPSLVPDMEKKIPKSIGSRISQTLNKRKGSGNAAVKESRKSQELLSHEAHHDDDDNDENNSSRELRRKLELGAMGFSSDAYQPKSAESQPKKKTKKKKKIVRNPLEDEDEDESDDEEEPYTPDFHINSETVEIPLSDEPSKIRKKKKKKKKMVRRSQSPKEESMGNRENLMKSTKASWKSESNLTDKKRKQTKMVTSLDLFFADDTEDEEIYDSEEITVASDVAPPTSPSQLQRATATSPSQLQRATAKGKLFHSSSSDGEEDSSSSSSEEHDDLQDSSSELKFQDDQEQQQRRSNTTPQFPPSSPRRNNNISPKRGEGMDSTDMRFPTTAARGRNQSPRNVQQPLSSPSTSRSVASSMLLPPISPPFRTKNSMIVMEEEEEEEDVTLRRSNSRDRCAFISAPPEEEEEVTLRRSNSRERLSTYLTSPTTVRKAFKNPDFAGGDLLQTPLLRRSASTGIISHSSPVVRKNTVQVKKSHVDSEPVVRKVSTTAAAANSATRRRRSKSRDKSTVQESLENAVLPSYVTPSRAERKKLELADFLDKDGPIRRASSSFKEKRRSTSSHKKEESPSSPILEMQGSLEQQLKVMMIPPLLTASDDEDIHSEEEEEALATMPKHRRTKSHQDELILPTTRSSKVHLAPPRRLSSLSTSSELMRNIQQEAEEKHQEHFKNRDSLLDVLALGESSNH